MPKIAVTIEQYEAMQEDNGGMCLACGAEAYGVEPDAENYECETCGKHKVMGCDNLLIMGYVS